MVDDAGEVSPAYARPFALTVLLPVMGAVLTGFLIIGIALPVLPLYVHQRLGFGTFVVGLVAGSQFAAAVITRIWAGSFADNRGGKRAVIAGLLAAAASGLLYLLSFAFIAMPPVSVGFLLLGRALLGGGESFIITGGVSWALSLVDTGHAGKVIAWIGTAMFAAMALGGPMGAVLYGAQGFGSIAIATALLPLAILPFILRMPTSAPIKKETRRSLGSIARAVWLPGLGAALSSIGYGAILAFSSLLFSERGWYPIWLAFTSFGVALIIARIFFGHLPDRRGGARTALLFVLIQSGGVALIWLADGPMMATAGAALAGFGYALVYPGLGVEAVRSVPAESRGLAMGIYTVFLDLAMGIGSPVLGLIAGWSGLGSVFLVSALVVLSAAIIPLRLMRLPKP